MSFKVFIDGEAGTTGLQIRERLQLRPEIELVLLGEARRKDLEARRDALNSADAVILCLPDAAALEAVDLVENPNVKIIDASTAHRTAPGWVYGFPELTKTQRSEIINAHRISNPGCYPTGFLGLTRPLVEAGLLPRDYPITVNATSGYTGGGKAMIAEFEDESHPAYPALAFRPYALHLGHKHVKEMQTHGGFTLAPIFTPAVGRFDQGMVVETPLHLSLLAPGTRLSDLRQVLAEHYAGEPFVTVADMETVSHTLQLDAEALKNTNQLALYVFGDEAAKQARLIAVLDNLGKGASGAAVQNLNLVLGLAETAGL